MGEYGLATLAFGLGMLAVLIVVISHYHNQKKIMELTQRLQEAKRAQEKQVTLVSDSVNNLRRDLLRECQEFTAQENQSFKEGISQNLREEKALVDQMNQDLLQLQEKMAAEFSGMLEWRQDLEVTMNTQAENQGVFVEHVHNQLENFAKQSLTLPDQLDAISGKLERIRQLKGELATLTQPIQLDAWKEPSPFERANDAV